MKKLMIAAAIVCAAAFAQAASTSWKVTALNLKSYTGGTSATAAYTDVVEIWISGGNLPEPFWLTEITPSSDGSIADVIFSSELPRVGNTYTFTYYLNNGQYELTSGTKSVTAVETGEAVLDWSDQQTYTSTAGNWKAVPEPTSAMLMLLGVAGLALKRKRA